MSVMTYSTIQTRCKDRFLCQRPITISMTCASTGFPSLSSYCMPMKWVMAGPTPRYTMVHCIWRDVSMSIQTQMGYVTDVLIVHAFLWWQNLVLQRHRVPCQWCTYLSEKVLRLWHSWGWQVPAACLKRGCPSMWHGKNTALVGWFVTKFTFGLSCSLIYGVNHAWCTQAPWQMASI